MKNGNYFWISVGQILSDPFINEGREFEKKQQPIRQRNGNYVLGDVFWGTFMNL
jgi:hypothetical protein